MSVSYSCTGIESTLSSCQSINADCGIKGDDHFDGIQPVVEQAAFVAIRCGSMQVNYCAFYEY